MSETVQASVTTVPVALFGAQGAPPAGATCRHCGAPAMPDHPGFYEIISRCTCEKDPSDECLGTCGCPPGERVEYFLCGDCFDRYCEMLDACYDSTDAYEPEVAA